MEIMLAIVVVAAVIFFGALISMGNERQRRAIDNLREQVVHWAQQDLRLKRAKLARDARVDDPLGWFNKLVSQAIGRGVILQMLEALENPRAILCTLKEGAGRVMLTPFSPGEIQRMKKARSNRLAKYADQSPLLSLPRKVTAFECSVLNQDILFDLELPLAWKGLTGYVAEDLRSVWVYWIP
jgi:hypothetical protein